jgi:hypothetical protein
VSLVTYIEHVHYAYDSCCIVARINLIISQMKRSGLRVLRRATWPDLLRLKAGTECWNQVGSRFVESKGHHGSQISVVNGM